MKAIRRIIGIMLFGLAAPFFLISAVILLLGIAILGEEDGWWE